MVEKLNAQPDRDAADSIRGYAYQAYQSILAWIRLKPGQALFLEGAEDIDLVQKMSATVTQIKDTKKSGNITLRSADVQSALKNFWKAKRDNPELEITFRFLTTSEIGKEQKSDFGEYETGIGYWEAIQRDHGLCIRPLKEFVQDLDIGYDLKSFLATADDDAVRKELFCSFFWDVGQKQAEGQKALIEDYLIHLGLKYDVNSHRSKQVLGALLDAVLDVLSDKDRKPLTQKGYIELFEKCTMELVTKSQANGVDALTRAQFQSLQADLQNPISAQSRPVPLVDNGIGRREIVVTLSRVLRKNGALVLTGSTGLGKTSLAKLAADNISDEWIWISFREIPINQYANYLRRLLQESIAFGLAAYVVLDDLDFSQIHSFEHSFLSLAFYIKASNGSLIATTQSEVPPDLLSKCWWSEEVVMSVPYFTEVDASELLENLGVTDVTDRAAWSALLVAMTRGHPQLLHARAVLQNARGWEADKIKDAIVDQGDTETTKEAARRRLLADFPSDDARNMAFRVSFLVGAFEKQLALSLGVVEPRVGIPGATLDLLIGPWIEKLEEDIFRVSPLLSNAGMKVYPVEDQIAIRRTIVDYYLKKGSITPHDLGSALMHSVLGEYEAALAQFSLAITTSDLAVRRRIGEAVPWIIAMDINQLRASFKYSGTAIVLGLAQFQVASAMSDADRALSVLSSLQPMVSDLEGADLQAAMQSMIHTCVVVSFEVLLPPSITLNSLAALYNLKTKDDELAALAQEFTEKHAVNDLTAGLSPFQSMFMLEASRVGGIGWFEEFLNVFDTLPSHVRKDLVPVFDHGDVGLSQTLVSSSWWNDASRDALDADQAIAVFRKAIERSKNWDLESLAVASFVAISIILDEYKDEKQNALLILDEADEHYQGSVYIALQRAKVHFHLEEYDKALSVYSFLDSESAKGDSIELTFSARMAGMAAGNVGRWKESAALFEKARRFRKEGSLENLKLGLLADTAFALWKAGEKAESVGVFTSVLEALENLPADESYESKVVHTLVRAVIGWINADCLHELPENGFKPYAGCCSNFGDNETIKNFPIADMQIVWGLLADVDDSIGSPNQIRVLEISKSNGKPYLNSIAASSIAKYRGLFEGRDVEQSVSILCLMISSSTKVAEVRAAGGDGWQHIDFEQLPPSYWNSTEGFESILLHLIPVVLVLVEKGEDLETYFGDWKRDFESIGLSQDQIEYFFGLVCNDAVVVEGSLGKRATSALGVLRQSEPSPNDVWAAGFYLLNALIGLKQRTSRVEKALEDLIVTSWKFALERQRFLLRQPSSTVPAIETALSSGLSGCAKVACILLACEDAISLEIQQDTQKFLNAVQQRFLDV